MDREKWDRTKWAEIGCIVCGIGTPITIGLTIWFGLHPTVSSAPSGTVAAPGSLPMSTTTVVGLCVVAVLVMIAAGLTLRALIRGNKRRPSNLAIVSAEYGSAERGWHDRKDTVESQIDGDSMSMLIGKELLGDPQGLEGFPKELVVQYRIDGGGIKRVVRPQSRRLILPEDQFLVDRIEELKGEIDKQRREHEDRVTTIASDNVKALGEALDEHRKVQQESKLVIQELNSKVASLEKGLLAPTQLHIPDISGTAGYLRIEAHGFLLHGGNRTEVCTIKMSFGLTSLGPEDATVSKLALVSIGGDRGIRTVSVEVLQKQLILSKDTLQSGVLTAKIEFASDGSDTIPQPLFLIVTDTYNGKHYIPVTGPIPELPIAQMPQLLIQYSEVERHDTFTFMNEGPGAIQNIEVGEVLMSKFKESSPANRVDNTIELTPFSGVGTILPGKEHANWRFGAKKDQTLCPLADFLRSFLEHDWTTIFSLIVKYEDTNKRKFSRRFVLSLDVYSKVTVLADPPIRALRAEI